MSTAAAVLKFVEINHGISFALNSLRIKYEASEGIQLSKAKHTITTNHEQDQC